MYLVFDIGGTSVKYALSDEQGELTPVESFPTPQTGMPDLLEGFRQVYERFSTRHSIEGIAISCPGSVDSEHGVISGTSAIPYIHQIPFGQLVSEALHNLPVSMENDAKCFAWGEMWKGEAVNAEHFASIAIGSGIGGALVHDRKVLKGSHFCSGEVSNFPLGRTEQGELVAWSEYTLVNKAKEYSQRHGRAVDGKMMLDLAEQGNVEAQKSVDDFFYHTALGCVMIQYCFDPEIIVIGGAISQRSDIIERLEVQVHQILDGKQYGFLKPVLVRSTHNNCSNLYGALYHFKQGGCIHGENN